MKRPWLAAGVAPPPPPPCAVCGDKFAPFGIGPPLAKVLQWFCGACNELQPATQLQLAGQARDAIESVDNAE